MLENTTGQIVKLSWEMSKTKTGDFIYMLQIGYNKSVMPHFQVPGCMITPKVILLIVRLVGPWPQSWWLTGPKSVWKSGPFLPQKIEEFKVNENNAEVKASVFTCHVRASATQPHEQFKSDCLFHISSKDHQKIPVTLMEL